MNKSQLLSSIRNEYHQKIIDNEIKLINYLKTNFKELQNKKIEYQYFRIMYSDISLFKLIGSSKRSFRKYYLLIQQEGDCQLKIKINHKEKEEILNRINEILLSRNKAFEFF